MLSGEDQGIGEIELRKSRINEPRNNRSQVRGAKASGARRGLSRDFLEPRPTPRASAPGTPDLSLRG